MSRSGLKRELYISVLPMPQSNRAVNSAKTIFRSTLLLAFNACSGSEAIGGVDATGGSRSDVGLGGAATVGGDASDGLGGSATNVLGGAVSGGGVTAAASGLTSTTTPSNGGTSNVGSTSSAGGSSGTSGTSSIAPGGTTARGGSTSSTAATGGFAGDGTSAKGGSSSGGTSMGGTTASTGTPGLRIVGRTAPGTVAGTIRFSWPGVNIHGRFTGTQVSMDLNDGTNKNRFTVVIDNGTPKTVTSAAGQTSLSLATGLANATHDIVIWRNTEAGMGITQFTGLSNFGTGGALLNSHAAPERRIEVIGDSLSVGAGDEGNATCTGGIDAFTNNYLAYGSVAARSVGADVVTIAWSGIGVYRNYDGSTSNTMPTRYPYAVANDNTAWDSSKYQPHVVVLNLGTNDFGAGDPGTAYETAYVSFIKTVRSKYAAAHFILIDMYGGNRLTRINNVVAQLKSGGESKVEMLSLGSVQNSLGCNQHPNVAAQAAMGNVLATRLTSVMGW
jgi:lysophospholipase L1-like esterase